MSDVLRPWKPRARDWDRAAARHLLVRTGFGATQAELERALERGFEATLADVFARDAHEPGLEEGIRPLLAAGSEETLQAWWMALILGGGAPLRERVTLMWHDHFATSNAKVDDVRLMHRQNELLRREGLADFRVLLHTLARDPAMLVWLDGNLNRRGQANENFAREVMELFALGIGNYDEHDVREVARAFTGWGTRGRAFRNREELHDPGIKDVLGRRGAFDGDAVLDVILASPACPRHVARRLLAEFVSTTPEEAWVTATAKTLTERDWSVQGTLEVLFASELFHRATHRRSRIAGPVELLATAARALGANLASKKAARAAAEMGQALFRPPSVKGWDGGRAWIDAGTWVARHNTLASLARARVEDVVGVRWETDAVLGETTARERLAAAVVERLLPDGLDSARARLLERAAREAADHEHALAIVTALILTSPEYQLI